MFTIKILFFLIGTFATRNLPLLVNVNGSSGTQQTCHQTVNRFRGIRGKQRTFLRWISCRSITVQ